MPVYTFDTAEPVSADLRLEFGGARIIARDGATTVVDVRPAREGRRADVEAAERTRVDFTDGRLEIRAPKPPYMGILGRSAGIEVLVEMPTGSHVRATSLYGDLDTEGRLGDCFLKTSYGSLRVADAGTIGLHTSAGNVSVGRVTGDAEISSFAGDLWAEEALGAANLKTSAGEIRVERSGAALTARTAYGGIRVARASTGELDLTTSYGEVEVGIADGTATFVELRSAHGQVRNRLERVEQPPDGGEVLRVRAVTAYGDITIRRA